jgi:hypothetical protein
MQKSFKFASNRFNLDQADSESQELFIFPVTIKHEITPRVFFKRLALFFVPQLKATLEAAFYF